MQRWKVIGHKLHCMAVSPIRDVLYHRLHGRPRYLDQMGSHLFEQASAFLGSQHLDQVLLGRGQNPLEPDEERHAHRNSTFDFALSIHHYDKYTKCVSNFLALPVERYTIRPKRSF